MKKKMLLIVIIVTLILSTSCIRKPVKKPIKIEQKEKAPASVFSVVEGIDNILGKVDQLEKIETLTEEELNIEKPKKVDKSESEDEKEKEKEKEKNDELLVKEDVLLKKWIDMEKEVEKVHESWNIYEVEFVKKAVNLEKTKDFKENLNLFTIAVNNKAIREVIDTGSGTLLSLSFFFDLYKDDFQGDLCRIKYAVYQGYLNSGNEDPNISHNFLMSTDEYIIRLRQKLDKDKDGIRNLDRLALSIEDMKLALKENNIELLKLKKNIILKNIDLLSI